MKRRVFFKSAGSAMMAAPLLTATNKAHSMNTEVTARDVQDYLRSLIHVSEPSVDRIIIGSPETRVKKIGTCWMPYFKTLKKAHKMGINVIVAHEPTFYAHWDLDEKPKNPSAYPDATDKAYAEMKAKKIRWIEDHGMVVIRSHDVPDKLPEIGMPFAFGQGLGFSNEDIIRSRTYYNVYAVDKAPAHKIAGKIAARLKEVDQAGVAFYGDPEAEVKSVGLGTGCACNPLDFMDLEADLMIAIDDSVHTWVQTTYAEDSGHPLIVVNHGTSEEFGMQALNKQLKKKYSDIDVIHLPQGCGYKWISG